jgi:hypothetical protein
VPLIQIAAKSSAPSKMKTAIMEEFTAANFPRCWTIVARIKKSEFRFTRQGIRMAHGIGANTWKY